ncbi:hypothetical protein BDB00DRAFT_853380 [Zychaea mexicana]|uniref:uncharacterized protein n=1 Tax=Zychaea mexicana TaxID=64656 RepID=UPI0022FEEB6B|nr:uncharacterized protein BDB00DRAFT_853380 [Zychaea mexicana]KAI9484808.1 hypothetical protein BDB00DRAFT_853380 [Zychaea mexicana]
MHETQCEQMISNNLEDVSYSLSEFVTNYIKLLNNSINYPLAHVYDQFQIFFNAFIPVFSSADSNYLLPFLKNLSTTLVDFAFHVDKVENLSVKKMKANGAARLLSKVFNIMLADRNPLQESKRLGIIHITNLAFKIYTKLDITNLCSTFITNLKTGGVELKDFPISQQVAHRYYLGRFSYYKQQLLRAEKHFQFAFQHCPANSWHNKRLILKFLIPTRIIMGKLPSMELLQKYKLENPYADLKQTIQRGDIRRFNAILEHNYAFFARSWSYLTLRARCPVLLWRSCLRRVFILTRQSDEDRVMSFRVCYDGLLAAGEDQDLDFYDTENILVSLISQGYIRGYLHHQLQQVVLSKVNPFPPISQIRPYVERYNDDAVEEHLKTNQPMLPHDIQAFIEESDEPPMQFGATLDGYDGFADQTYEEAAQAGAGGFGMMASMDGGAGGFNSGTNENNLYFQQAI